MLNAEPNAATRRAAPESPRAPHGPLRYEDVPDEHILKDDSGNVIEHLTKAVKRTAREKES